MSQKSLAELSQKMRQIDIAILSTHAENGAIAGRPMSSNKDVDYDGTSHYFTHQDTNTVTDIERDPTVGLGFQGPGNFYVAVEGKAELIRDKDAFREHWAPDLDRWFENGIETDGIILIRVEASRIHWWDGLEDGEITP